jgi:uncharacterized protein
VRADAAREAWATDRQRIERGSYWVSPAGRRLRWRGRILSVALGTFGLLARLGGFYRHGRRNALAPVLVELELSFPTLPAAFDGYRILHLSDTHLDILPELGGIAGGLLEGVAVDLIALTGDILGKRSAALHRATAPLVRMLAGVRVRDRSFAVLGNHDPATMADALVAEGFEVLLNRTAAIERNGEQLWVTGLDDVHSFYTEAARAALSETAAGFPHSSIPPRSPITPAPPGSRSIYAAIPMVDRFACPTVSR